MSLSRHHLFAITVLAFELFTRPAFGQVPTPTVSVSSENAYTGQLGTKALDGAIEGWPGVYTREWATVRQLAGAWIQLNWNSPVQVSRIALWDRPNQWDNVLAGTLTFSDGSAFAVGALPSDASSAFVASFVTKSITWVRFTITAAQGLNIGLSEFQVFGTSSLTYSAATTVSSISPNSVPTTGGTTVSIFGTGFQSGAVVSFGAVLATSVSVISSTQIQAVTPASAAGTVNVAVGTASLNSAFTFFSSSSKPSFFTADPNANDEAKAILSYFYNLPNGSTHRVVTSTAVAIGGCATGDCDAWINQLYTAGGNKYQAAAEFSYCNPGINPCRFDYTTINNAAIAYWNAGGYVEMSEFFQNPVTGGSASDRTGISDSVVAQMLANGTYQNTAWNTELDKYATGISALQSDGVVVFLRPFHEMNADWFWWGRGTMSAASFIDLWRYTFNYLTTTKGLHNLLWMWTPYDYTSTGDLYPGDGYVDMVGASCFAPIGAGASFNSYSELVSHGKPVGIGEFGPGNPPSNNSYNYANLIAAIKASYPNVVWVNQWWGGYSMANQFGGSTFMADPWIIDRSEITVH